MYEPFAEVTCPACFQNFEVAIPAPEELPTSLDYDCEICCRPMVIQVEIVGCGDVLVDAHSLED